MSRDSLASQPASHAAAVASAFDGATPITTIETAPKINNLKVKSILLSCSFSLWSVFFNDRIFLLKQNSTPRFFCCQCCLNENSKKNCVFLLFSLWIHIIHIYRMRQGQKSETSQDEGGGLGVSAKTVRRAAFTVCNSGRSDITARIGRRSMAHLLWGFKAVSC